MQNFRHALAWFALWACNSGSMLHATGQTDTKPTDQDATEQTGATPQKAKRLEKVTVTGSLIPQSQIETATPILTITAKDIKARGFANIADALQQASFATGAVSNSQSVASETRGASTLSMFGLPVGFVKYLLDGRPMGDFPALYGGGEVFNNIGGIPMDLVDHIDILPGGQSSLYGSDAIAGVINIVLKKEVAAPMLDARYGWTTGGGHASRSVSFVNDYRKGNFHLLAGVQLESTQPMWGFDRKLTDHAFDQGTGPMIISPDFNILQSGGNKFYLKDARQCGGLAALFDGSERKYTDSERGSTCASVRNAAYSTLRDGEKSVAPYLHANWDISEKLHFYGDVLYGQSLSRYSDGVTEWNTRKDSLTYFDPGIGDSVDLLRGFAPEEAGGYSHVMDKQHLRSMMANLGGNGTIGTSNWEYDLGLNHTEQHAKNLDFDVLKEPADNYFKSHVLGAQHGWHGGVPVYTPDYSAYYQPVPVTDFRNFTTYVQTQSKTWSNLLRGQVTNTSLLSMPGGDAGLAVALEAANQAWAYVPEARLVGGAIWGANSVQGAGKRSRYAATSEFRVPLLRRLTANVSGRWDSYKIAGNHVQHGTYTLSLEYRPLDSLLVRGRYGTAFKAPTLADEFQGISSFSSVVVDYLNCGRLGYSLKNSRSCPQKYSFARMTRQTAGNLSLQPITAKTWTFGAVWVPVERMWLSVDYLHWNIDNEVTAESIEQLARDEYFCDVGKLNPASGTCRQAFSKITRGNPDVPGLLGPIIKVFDSKVNISNEQVNAVTANFNYLFVLKDRGELSLNASYSDVLKHLKQRYPNDLVLDLFKRPGQVYDFKSKLNGSVTWSPDKQWSATLYIGRSGSQPNYLATSNANFTAEGAGRLPAWIRYNASVGWKPSENMSLSFQVNNLFNKMPPLDRGYPNGINRAYRGSIYNPFGRTMYVEAAYQLGKRH